MRLQKGTSIIEALIALLILSIGLVSIGLMQARVLASNNLAKQRTEAATVAQDIIEEFKDYAVIESTSGYFAYDDIVSGSSTVNGVNADYSVTWTVTDSTNPNYKTIDVSITWTGGTRESEAIMISTIIGEKDPALIASIN